MSRSTSTNFLDFENHTWRLFDNSYDAGVNWCEKNFVWTPYIAEFVNFMTAAPFILTQSWMMITLLRPKYRNIMESRLLIYMFLDLTQVIVGLTLHATLTYWSGILENMVRLIANLSLSYILMFMDENPEEVLIRERKIYWASVAVIVPLGYVFLEFTDILPFVITIAAFAMLGVVVIVFLIKLNFYEDKEIKDAIWTSNDKQKLWNLIALGSMCIGGVFALLDVVFCHQYNTLECSDYINGHAVWHICINITALYYVGVFVTMRMHYRLLILTKEERMMSTNRVKSVSASPSPVPRGNDGEDYETTFDVVEPSEDAERRQKLKEDLTDFVNSRSKYFPFVF